MVTEAGAPIVREVTRASDLREFVEFPYRFYRDEPRWIPPLRLIERGRLDRSRNHFFEHADAAFFLAESGGSVVGRIAAIDDHRHNEFHKDDRLASFGFFEAASAAAARALFASAEAWCRRRGRARIRGPLNPSLNENAGLLVSGFDDPPALLMPYNPPEYQRYIEEAGYAKAKDLYAWLFDMDAVQPAPFIALIERVRARLRPEIRFIPRRHVSANFSTLNDLYCRAWAGSWGFVPPTDKEMRQLVADLSWIVGEHDVMLVEIQGRPAAFGVCVLDMNQLLAGTRGRLVPFAWRWLRRRRIITRGRFILLGVAPEYQQLGLFPLMAYEFYRQFKGVYRYIEDSWVLEDNANINGPASAMATLSKTYRLFEKGL
jgi:hypothetical protein